MDKETLSNYGWIVIAVMVLVVMIALATPFGKFVSKAVQNTTQGLFDVNQNALNQTNLIPGGIPDQSFEEITNNTETQTAGAFLVSYCDFNEWEDVVVNIEMTWDEFLSQENQTKYQYTAKVVNGVFSMDIDEDTTFGKIVLPNNVEKIDVSITDTGSLGDVYVSSSVKDIDFYTDYDTINSFVIDKNNPYLCVVDEVVYSKNMDTLVRVLPSAKGEFIIPNSVTTIGEHAFQLCYDTEIIIPKTVTKFNNYIFEDVFNDVKYQGTLEEFNAINKASYWSAYFGGPEGNASVVCTDGIYHIKCNTVTIGATKESECDECYGPCKHRNLCYHEDVDFSNHEKYYDTYEENGVIYCDCGLSGGNHQESCGNCGLDIEPAGLYSLPYCMDCYEFVN